MPRPKMEVVPEPTNGLDRKKLTGFVERIEHISEERAALTADIASVYKEAKEQGFDGRYIRRCIKLRKMTAVERENEQETLDLYMHALGMLADTPLGQAAALARYAAGS